MCRLVTQNLNLIHVKFRLKTWQNVQQVKSEYFLEALYFKDLTQLVTSWFQWCQVMPVAIIPKETNKYIVNIVLLSFHHVVYLKMRPFLYHKIKWYHNLSSRGSNSLKRVISKRVIFNCIVSVPVHRLRVVLDLMLTSFSTVGLVRCDVRFNIRFNIRPISFWTIQTALNVFAFSEGGLGDTQIQTHCGEETNVRRCGVEFGQRKGIG